jgi:hypothetical protein
MSNWRGAERTNYVTIKDIEALKRDLHPDVEVHEGKPGTYAFSPATQDGGFPSSLMDENDQDEDFDLVETVLGHMQDDEVLVLVSAGAEKRRYVTGFASAHMRNKPDVVINIGSIYERAEAAFGCRPTRAEY